MSLVRYGGSQELSGLQKEVNSLFDGFFSRSPMLASLNQWMPKMDLVEKNDHYQMRVDLPGVEKDDLKINWRDGVLSVSGERRQEHQEERDGRNFYERSYGKFSRSLEVGHINPDQIKASFNNGVLEVSVPKPEGTEEKQIEITAETTAADSSE